MKYQLIQLTNESESPGDWCIIESATMNMLAIYKDEAEARKNLNFYNMKGAFDGQTPGFMLTEINYPKKEEFGDNPLVLSE